MKRSAALAAMVVLVLTDAHEAPSAGESQVAADHRLIVRGANDEALPAESAKVLADVSATALGTLATGAYIFHVSRPLSALEINALLQTGHVDYIEADRSTAGASIDPAYVARIDPQLASAELSIADLANAIVWAAGGEVPGMRLNSQPLSLITLSYDETLPCGSTMQAAVRIAQEHGATVLASNGHTTSAYEPALCGMGETSIPLQPFD